MRASKQGRITDKSPLMETFHYQNGLHRQLTINWGLIWVTLKVLFAAILAHFHGSIMMTCFYAFLISLTCEKQHIRGTIKLLARQSAT